MPIEDPNFSQNIEQLAEREDLSIEKLACHYRQLVFQNMMCTRGPKYRYFLWALRASKYASCQLVRGAFLENYYALMRYLDDIVDDDAPLPDGYSSATEYMDRKIDFAREPVESIDSSEMVMAHCFDIGRQFGEEFGAETADILGSLRFDAARKNPEDPQIMSSNELQHHFHLLDIRGTISACLKLADEKDVTSEDLEPLGNASRIHYTLRDYSEDLEAGFVNIPQEDMAAFGISQSDLSTSSAPVRKWMVAQAQKGIELLSEHRQSLPRLPMKRFIKAALWGIYERPARNCFKNILRRHG